MNAHHRAAVDALAAVLRQAIEELPHAETLRLAADLVAVGTSVPPDESHRVITAELRTALPITPKQAEQLAIPLARELSRWRARLPTSALAEEPTRRSRWADEDIDDTAERGGWGL